MKNIGDLSFNQRKVISITSSQSPVNFTTVTIPENVAYININFGTPLQEYIIGSATIASSNIAITTNLSRIYVKESLFETGTFELGS